MRDFHDQDGLPVTSGGHGASAGCAPPNAPAAQSAGEDRALTGDVVERVRVGPYMADVQLMRRDGGLWIACTTISTETGVLSWCGAATEQEVAQRLARRRRRVSGASAGFNFGSFLNSLGQQISQGTQQLARNRSLRRVVSDVNTTLNRPELQPVLAVAQQIPYLGQALGAVRAAATIADQVLGGNPEARGRLASIRQAAQGGNPVARQALEVLNDVLQAQQNSAQQRAGAPPRRGPAPPRGRGPRRRRPHRRGAPGRSSRGGPRRRGSPPRRQRRRRPPRGGARSSGAEEQAWREASERWAEHAEATNAANGSLITPAPSR